jgi:hypothetical protein
MSRFSVDLDFGDVCFDDCFALAGCAGGQDVGEVVAESLDVLWAGWGWRAAGELVEFVAAVAELVELCGEVADAVAAGAFVEGAVFERGQVPVDGCFGGGDGAGDGVEFGVVAVVAVGAAGLFGGDGGVDEVGAAVEVDQRLLYRLVEVVGVDAGGGAAGGAVAGAGEAGVVAVAA